MSEEAPQPARSAGSRKRRSGGGSERPSVTVRPMEIHDLAPVYELGEKLFTASDWPSLYRTWDEYEPVELFASDGEFCFVAEAEKTLAGFILGTLIDKRQSAWTYGYINWIGIEPDWQRRGVAGRLINRLQDTFIEAGARMLILDTDAQNERAIRFFEDHDFRGEVKHLYMSKNLTALPAYQRHRRKQGQNGASGGDASSRRRSRRTDGSKHSP